jgi:hypothetical protein
MLAFVDEIASCSVEALLSRKNNTMMELIPEEEQEDIVADLFGPHKKLKKLIDKTSRYSPLIEDVLETCAYRMGSTHYKLRYSNNGYKHSSLG